MWQVNIATLFPNLYPGILAHSLTGRAIEDEKCMINPINIRDYAKDKHKTVDDTCYGGGAGMLMKAETIADMIDAEFIPNGLPIFYLSPQGEKFDQKLAKELVDLDGINLLCGRYEGIDERVFLEYNIRSISLGDFVLTSGDAAVFPILDACMRLLPGVLGDDKSTEEESFGMCEQYENLLEYPQYTKPAEWRGHKVPDILLSGNHAEIEKWRLKAAEKKTKVARPDLWDLYNKER